MKPTQEQVVQWAREAKLYADDYADPNVHDDWFKLNDLHFATLAYEAGRKDENEACAKFIEDCDPSDHLAATIAAAIRARGAP